MPEEKSLQAQIDDLKEQLESAFDKDAHGGLLLVEHKLYHKDKREEEELNKVKRNKLMSDVVSWAVVGLLSVVCSVAYEYAKSHFHGVFGLLNF